MIAALFAALAASSSAALDLGEVLVEVSAHAPSIAVQAAAVAAAKAGVGVAGAWEDPTLSVMIEDVALRSDPEMPMDPMLTYRVMQPLGTLFGRRGLAKSAARARVERETSVLRRVEWDARRAALGAFYELWMQQEMGRVLDRQIDALERMKRSAKAQYEAGLMMGHHDYLRAEAEIAAMSAERASLVDRRRGAWAMLAVLRGAPPDGEPAPVAAPAAAPPPPLEAILAAAGARPELAAMQAMKSEALAETGLARRMYLPMLMAGAFFQQRTGAEPNSIGAEVAVTLPIFWWDRQDHELAMAEAMVARADRELEAMRKMTEADLRAAYAELVAEDRAVSALEEVAIPRLEETIASTQAAYASGSGNFLSLLDAVMSLLQLEGRRIERVVRRELARADVERIVARAIAPADREGSEP